MKKILLFFAFLFCVSYSFGQNYPFECKYYEPAYWCMMNENTEMSDEEPGLEIKCYTKKNASCGVQLDIIGIDDIGQDIVTLANMAMRDYDKSKKDDNFFNRFNSRLSIELSNGEIFQTSLAVLRALNTTTQLMNYATDLGGRISVEFNFISEFKSNKKDMSNMSIRDQNKYMAQMFRAYNFDSFTIEGITFKCSHFQSATTFDAMFNTLAEKIGDSDVFQYSSPNSLGSSNSNNTSNISSNSSVSHSSVSANIKSISTEHNVYGNAIKGMNVIFSFDVKGMKGKTGDIVVYFYFKNGDKLRDYNQRYCASDGGVCSSKTFAPRYDSSTYTDVKVFIPYQELHLSNGYHNLKANVVIYDSNSNVNYNKLCKSDWVYFDWQSN